jgi:hypothetical protein
MGIKIYSRGSKKIVLYESTANNHRDAVREAVKANVNLREADLTNITINGPLRTALCHGQFMNVDWSGSDLSHTDFSFSNLFGAVFFNCNLQKTDFANANLSLSDMEGSDCSLARMENVVLCRSKCRGCNFTKAKLTYANMVYMDVAGAIFNEANLSYANVTGSNLYASRTSLITFLYSLSVSDLLRLDWGDLPKELALELMRHNAESCGEVAMNKWVEGGVYPFLQICRDYLFSESRELWEPGPPKLRGMKLLQTLWEAKGGKCKNEA